MKFSQSNLFSTKTSKAARQSECLGTNTKRNSTGLILSENLYGSMEPPDGKDPLNVEYGDKSRDKRVPSRQRVIGENGILCTYNVIISK